MKIYSAIFALLFLITSYYVYQNISFFDTKIINFISISGTIASIFGLILVLIQTSHAIKLSEAIKESAEKSRTKILSLFNVIDLVKLQKTISEIQFYNRTRKFSLSMLRMQELREGLQNIRCNADYIVIISEKKINSMISTVSIDISTLEKQLSSEDKIADILKLNDNLDLILKEVNILNSQIRLNGE